MKISIRKKSIIVLGLLVSSAMVCNQSCERQIVLAPPSDKQATINEQPSVSIIQENIIDMSKIDAFCELVADLFEGKNQANTNKSITDLIQDALDLINENRPTFDAFRGKAKIDKIVMVFEKIKEGIRSGYFYNDSKWCGKLPGPRLTEMANLLKEFVGDLPAATRQRLTVSKLQQLAMLQVLIKRLGLEKVKGG